MPQEKIISDVRPENSFYLKDGRILRNIYELSEAIRLMKDDVFRYHVNSSKNDFANWIGDVLGDEELANKVSKIKEPKAMHRAISSRIAAIEKKLTNEKLKDLKQEDSELKKVEDQLVKAESQLVAKIGGLELKSLILGFAVGVAIGALLAFFIFRG